MGVMRGYEAALQRSYGGKSIVEEARLGLAFLPALIAGWIVYGMWPWPNGAWPMIGLTFIAHLYAFVATERMLRYPGRETWGVAAFNLAMSFLVVAAVLALGRMYFSRAFLLIAWGLAFPLLLLYAHTIPRACLALISGGLVGDLLREIDQHSFCSDSLDKAEAVVVDLHHIKSENLKLVAEAALRGLPVLHAANVYESYTGRIPLQSEYAEEFASLASKDIGLYLPIKRILELIAIIILLPIITIAVILTAAAVYIDLGRPVFIGQERVGMAGKPFRAYKFRTMKGLPREGIYAGDELNRISKIGKLLRKFRLDELPQILNVVIGDMSMIGPRPEQKVLVKKYEMDIPFYALRHAVRPGLTGWAQVHQGYAEGTEGAKKKLSYDLYYLKHLSLWLDMRIVVRTIWVILTGFGAK